jgi:hypothetical protein
MNATKAVFGGMMQPGKVIAGDGDLSVPGTAAEFQLAPLDVHSLPARPILSQVFRTWCAAQYLMPVTLYRLLDVESVCH